MEKYQSSIYISAPQVLFGPASGYCGWLNTSAQLAMVLSRFIFTFGRDLFVVCWFVDETQSCPGSFFCCSWTKV